MGKPIKLNEQFIDELTRRFRADLANFKMSESKINYTFNMKGVLDNDSRAKIVFTCKAYTKMLALINHYTSEVGWHGLVQRVDDNTFYIIDIVVYPQEVTGVTVNTDQEKYTDWLYAFDEHDFPLIRMHGHSHVHMATSPSGTDLQHREGILSQLTDNDFYIFMIWNKEMDYTTKIFDLQNNVMYDSDEVDVYVEDFQVTMEEFIDDSDSKVTTKKQKNTYKKNTDKQSSFANWYNNELYY